MAVNIKVEPIRAAIEKHPEPKTRLAILAGSSEVTMRKLLDRDGSLSLSAINSIANYLGYDVEVSFRRRKEVVAGSN